MKLITAIVRPEKLDELIDALVDNRAHGLTVTEVRGFGRQFGQLAERPRPVRVTLLHKVRLDVVTLDDDMEHPCRGHRQARQDGNDRRREDIGPPGRRRPARPDR